MNIAYMLLLCIAHCIYTRTHIHWKIEYAHDSDQLSWFTLKGMRVCIRVYTHRVYIFIIFSFFRHILFSHLLYALRLIFTNTFFPLIYILRCFVCSFVWRIGQRAPIFTFREWYIKSFALPYTRAHTHTSISFTYACTQWHTHDEKRMKTHEE